MFEQIAPRYDLLNHLLSMQLDRIWRARVARRLRSVLARPDARVLDVCCGTGDLALALARAGSARIAGTDFAYPMLVRARQKAATMAAPEPGRDLRFFEADALRLPAAEGTFDAVTTAFGFRNLVNYEAGLRELLRVLRPGGVLAILEFMEPPEGIVGGLYRWYFRKVLPRIGGAISGDAAAYRYLPASVSRFFRPDELAQSMKDAGYESVEFQVWTLGTVALHTGRKPGSA
jgi:demethylmenaquinone methyltransferase/2-methoxy-6-polyprenyl-1,4-benzoquinol methylase